MDAFLQQFQHLKIQLEEIKSATNNFDDEKNRIGVGGFGKVYRGEVSHSEGRSVAAIKRLDRRHGQGEPEFLKEIDTLSSYRHENIISLLGFCYQEDEMILVYELASRRSLDRHLNSTDLTWSKRIKICLDAAKGLRYLHDPRGTHQRLIHCDVKSGNILLDDQWNAKIADFGFSMMGPANGLKSTVINLAAGTHGYIDPQYLMTHTLTKESDVYSFGVVLFEVLCGRLCCTYSNNHVQNNLVPAWIESYKQKKLNDIIFKDPSIPAMDQSALETFSDIACRCLKQSREDRPKMAEVVTELETALETQELHEIQELQHQKFIGEWNKQRSYYEKITKSAEPPLNYRSDDEFWKLLCEGVLLNKGKTYLSLNKKGAHCEMISIGECLGSEFKRRSWAKYNSRFPSGTYRSRDGIFKTHVKTQFLSPGITYTVNLVFMFDRLNTEDIDWYPTSLRYKLQGETKSSISYFTYAREDGWWMWELYQFTSDHRSVDLEIMFDGFFNHSGTIEVEGIEFRPLEEVEQKDEKQPISNSDSDLDSSDANWEEKLAANYEDMIKWSTESVQWTTKKEAYSILRKGFLMNTGKIWFYLDKNGKKCHMVSTKMYDLLWWGDKKSLPESRFGEVVSCDLERIYITYGILPKLVSSETKYAIYLVYKLPEDHSGFEAPVEVRQHHSGHKIWYIYLATPQNQYLLNKPNIKGRPQKRNDGWMEVKVSKFRAATKIQINISMTSCNNQMQSSRIIIEGIEFRPI